MNTFRGFNVPDVGEPEFATQSLSLAKLFFDRGEKYFCSGRKCSYMQTHNDDDCLGCIFCQASTRAGIYAPADPDKLNAFADWLLENGLESNRTGYCRKLSRNRSSTVQKMED